MRDTLKQVCDSLLRVRDTLKEFSDTEGQTHKFYLLFAKRLRFKPIFRRRFWRASQEFPQDNRGEKKLSAFDASVLKSIIQTWKGTEKVMICWHCNEELDLDFTTADFEKYYHCAVCEKWYELSKERVKINGAVPVKFVELENRPQLPVENYSSYV